MQKWIRFCGGALLGIDGVVRAGWESGTPGNANKLKQRNVDAE